jgi:hypothetical protein
VVKLEPGNAYLFWGYRAFHATLPCAPGALRATLMLHYGELHSGDHLLAISHLASAPHAGMSEDELIACIDWVAHGFEIVHSVLEHICARPLPRMTQRTMAVGKGPPSQIGC